MIAHSSSLIRAAAPLLALALTMLFAATAGANEAPRPQVAAGGSHVCALGDNGKVQCWGSGAAGQLGNGTTVDAAAPTPIAGVVTAKQGDGMEPLPQLKKIGSIAASASATCAISEGLVWCWGSNAHGELGAGTVDATPHPLPQNVPGVKDAYVITAGTDHFCAGAWTGVIKCWGSNSAGQIGSGTVGTDVPTATAVPGVKKLKALGAGAAYTCVISETTKPTCFGSVAAPAIKDVYELVPNANSICAKGWGDPQTRCWGGTAVDVPTVLDVKAWGGTANETCAVSKLVAAKTEKTTVARGLMCWTPTNPAPTLVPLADVAGLSVGSSASTQCAIVRGGEVHCWTAGTPTPVQVPGLDLVTRPQYPNWASITPLTKVRGGQIKTKVTIEPSSFTFPEDACKGSITPEVYFYKKVRAGKSAKADAANNGGWEYKKVGVRGQSVKLRRAGDYCKAELTHSIPQSFRSKRKLLKIGAYTQGNASMEKFSVEFELKKLNDYFKKK